MQPYYSSGGITIYHADSRDVLPSLCEKPALVLADPPYGMGYKGPEHERLAHQRMADHANNEALKLAARMSEMEEKDG